MAYEWPEYPVSGCDNFEYNARYALTAYRENGIDMEYRLDNLQQGIGFEENSLHGSLIIDDTVPPVKLETGNTPTDGFVLSYNASSGIFDWINVEGAIGADTYQVKYNNAGSPMFLEGHMATEEEVSEGVRDDVLVSPATLSAIAGALFPTGCVLPFANAIGIDGWLVCDGREVSRIEYATLFSIIGTIYGEGNQTTTFNLPDLRGEFIRGAAIDGDVDSGRQIGSKQSDAYRLHGHGIPALSGSTNTVPNHTHYGCTIVGGQGGPGGNFDVPVRGDVGAGGAHNHSLSTNASNTHNAGSSETRPRNVAMVYYIKS